MSEIVPSGPDVAGVAALIGDKTRATMLVALMDGRALTAGELARIAGVAPQTASGHLVRLLDGGLLSMEKQSRHRYYRLATAETAHLIESLMVIARGDPVPAKKPGPKDAALRRARTCYDHLAGELGVMIAGVFLNNRLIQSAGTEFHITRAGQDALADLDIILTDKRWGSHARPQCLGCLDWSERRLHLAGKLGFALAVRLSELGWIKRQRGRGVIVTPLGYQELRRRWGISFLS